MLKLPAMNNKPFEQPQYNADVIMSKISSDIIAASKVNFFPKRFSTLVSKSLNKTRLVTESCFD